MSMYKHRHLYIDMGGNLLVLSTTHQALYLSAQFIQIIEL